MQTFGVNAIDGTLAICKAKPENRGRGNCTHGDHVELDGAMGAPATVQAYNEERLAEHFQSTALTSLKKKMVPAPPPSAARFKPRRQLSRQELLEATEAISDVFPDGSWELLNGFYSNFNSLISEEERLNHTREQVKDRVQAYLESDDPVAVKVRAYLGEEVSPADFSAILVSDVRSMTASGVLRNQPKNDSVSRIMLTSVANDMTKRRYVASVLFFAGRCCYCKCVMSKDHGPTQATGEHITPLSPEDNSAPVGVTRYGNMALACHRCNNERANKDLTDWVSKTTLIKDSDKPEALARIKAFRRFALYEEYSPEQSRKLKKAVSTVRRELEALDRPRGRWAPDDFKAISEKMKTTLYDLRTSLEA